MSKPKRVNVLLLADFIESHTDLKFNMRNPFFKGPQSSGCIGAFAQECFQPDAYVCSSFELAKIFNIKVRLAHQMVIATRDKKGKALSYDNIDRKSAVAMLRRFAKTGKVYFTSKHERLLESLLV